MTFGRKIHAVQLVIGQPREKLSGIEIMVGGGGADPDIDVAGLVAITEPQFAPGAELPARAEFRHIAARAGLSDVVARAVEQVDVLGLVAELSRNEVARTRVDGLEYLPEEYRFIANLAADAQFPVERVDLRSGVGHAQAEWRIAFEIGGGDHAGLQVARPPGLLLGLDDDPGLAVVVHQFIAHGLEQFQAVDLLDIVFQLGDVQGLARLGGDMARDDFVADLGLVVDPDESDHPAFGPGFPPGSQVTVVVSLAERIPAQRRFYPACGLFAERHRLADAVEASGADVAQ